MLLARAGVLTTGALLMCTPAREPAPSPGHPAVDSAQPSETPGDPYAAARHRMVAEQIAARGVTDAAVLGAMGKVPRHLFLPVASRHEAYDDHPVPIGHEQTISQPYIVALMTDAVRPAPHKKALDVGTGSGYQAAVLAELSRQVFSIEILCPLADRARGLLSKLGYQNVEIRCGDGYEGWPSQAPFDIIVVAAAPSRVPQPLLDQLAVGGRLVIPVGTREQSLQVYEKKADGSLRTDDWGAVRFVPMTGRAREPTGD